MSSSGSRGIPPIQLSEPLYKTALERAGVPAHSLPPEVLARLKTRLEDGLQQELETEFDRRYLRAIEATDHKFSHQELAVLERRVAESLIEEPLSEAHLLDRTEELVHKIFSGSPRTPDTALKTALKSESRLEKAPFLPRELSMLVGEYILGEEGSSFDLQDALQACELFAGTDLEPALLLQIEHFILSRLKQFEPYRDILTPAFGALLDQALPVLRGDRSPDREYLQQMRGWLQQLTTLKGPWFTAGQNLSEEELNLLLISALELGDAAAFGRERIPKGAVPFSTLAPSPLFRLLRALPHGIQLCHAVEEILALLITRANAHDQEAPSIQDLRLWILSRPEWKDNLQEAQELISILLKYNAPFELIEPVLVQWCQLTPDLHVLTCDGTGAPLESAIKALRPDVVQFLLEHGVSPHTLGGLHCLDLRRKAPHPISIYVEGIFLGLGDVQVYRGKELKRLFTTAAARDIPLEDLERTGSSALAEFLVGFLKGEIPANMLLGLSPNSPANDLEQRVQILKNKALHAQPALEQALDGLQRIHPHPTLMMNALFDIAAEMIRSGRPTKRLPQLRLPQLEYRLMNFRSWCVEAVPRLLQEDPSHVLLALLNASPEWLISPDKVDSLLSILLKHEAPLSLIEPVLRQWYALHPQVLHTLTDSDDAYYPPLPARAVQALRPDVIRVMLELGVSPYSTTRQGVSLSLLSTLAATTLPTTLEQSARKQELMKLLTNAPDLPLEDLECTDQLNLGRILTLFSQGAAPAHALLGVSPHSIGADLDQRVRILKEKIRSQAFIRLASRQDYLQDVWSWYRKVPFPEYMVKIMFDVAADLVRAGRGTERLPAPSPGDQALKRWVQEAAPDIETSPGLALFALITAHPLPPEWPGERSARRVIEALLQNEAPLFLIEPVLKQWCDHNPHCCHVLTSSDSSSSPLMCALRACRPDVVQCLLDLGVSPYSTTYVDGILTYPLTFVSIALPPTPEQKELYSLLDSVPDLPLEDLERTTPAAIADLLACFVQGNLPAYALFGLSNPDGRGGPSATQLARIGLSPQRYREQTLNQRLQILKQKLQDPKARYLFALALQKDEMDLSSPPDDDLIEQMLDEAANLVRKA